MRDYHRRDVGGKRSRSASATRSHDVDVKRSRSASATRSRDVDVRNWTKHDVVKWLDKYLPPKVVAALTNSEDGVLRSGPFVLNATAAKVNDVLGVKEGMSLEVGMLLQQLSKLQEPYRRHNNKAAQRR